MEKLKVSPELAGLRLDIFLHAHFLDFSRRWIQKLIKKGAARANGKVQPAKYRVKAGDTAEFNFELPPEISLESDVSLNSKIKIIFENEDFLVVEKPTGVVVHPSSAKPKGTLVNWLLAHCPDIESVGEPGKGVNLRPGIVHRLDKETSGVMVIAKNQETFNWLKQQFKNRQVVKKYVTLVNGQLKGESGEINLNIVRSKRDPTRNTAVRSKNEGRPAVTFWRVLHRYPGYTLLEVMPKTGRMHQIRVHLKAIGFPVVGDTKYTGRSAHALKHLGRMFLHAAYLSFRSPNGEKFAFNSPLAPELDIALKNLLFVLE